MMDGNKTELINVCKRHQGKWVGALIGLCFALLVVTLGVIKALFLSLCTLIGFFIGKRIDEGQKLGEMLERFLPSRLR